MKLNEKIRILRENNNYSKEDIEEITHKKYDTIKVFGGGSKNKFLNQLTEDITKKRVIEGPSEATAIGNIYSLLD